VRRSFFAAAPNHLAAEAFGTGFVNLPIAAHGGGGSAMPAAKDDDTDLISLEHAAMLASGLFEGAPEFAVARMVRRLLVEAERLRRRRRPRAAANQERLAEALLAEIKRRAN
jgi:hypothetical protein